MKKTVFSFALSGALFTACQSSDQAVQTVNTADMSAKIEALKKEKIELSTDILLEKQYYLASETQAVVTLPNKTFGKKVKNVILLIGDGMGPAQVQAGIIANKGKLNIEQTSHAGYSKTLNAYGKITDSAAGGTAISTGTKTYNSAIGVDTLKVPQITFLELMQKEGKATGLISTGDITDATPASFAAHHTSRGDKQIIAAQMCDTNVDMLVGGGLKNFNSREDKRNLIEEEQKEGYQVVYSIDELEKTTASKVLTFTDSTGVGNYAERTNDWLARSTKKAIETLSKDEEGFFLMVESAQIDYAGHGNHNNYIVGEMLDFDKAIGEALKFAVADGETLVVITADHETGGFTIVNADERKGEIHGKFTSRNHTAVMVPVFSYGPQAELFSGIYENTAIFDKMVEATK